MKLPNLIEQGLELRIVERHNPRLPRERETHNHRSSLAGAVLPDASCGKRARSRSTGTRKEFVISRLPERRGGNSLRSGGGMSRERGALRAYDAARHTRTVESRLVRFPCGAFSSKGGAFCTRALSGSAQSLSRSRG